jgi:hypothetical protein
VELLVAVVVVAFLVGLIVAVVRWAGGGVAYDDGSSQLYSAYVSEPSERGGDDGRLHGHDGGSHRDDGSHDGDGGDGGSDGGGGDGGGSGGSGGGGSGGGGGGSGGD